MNKRHPNVNAIQLRTGSRFHLNDSGFHRHRGGVPQALGCRFPWARAKLAPWRPIPPIFRQLPPPVSQR